MRTIRLGRTDARVSAISLGTWSYGGASKAGEQSVGWSGQDDRESAAALIRAWELGINHWDTADVYGNGHSEEIIGSVWGTVPREDIFLATKVGWDRGGYPRWYHPDMIRSHVERSLRNLRTDRVDLLYLHHCNFGDQGEWLPEAIATLRELQQEGKTRFIGLSDWYSEKIMRYIGEVDPDVVQPYRNVMDDTFQSSGLKAYCETRDIGVCFFSPLKHGLLTGKYRKPVTFPEGDYRQNVPEFQDAALIQRLQEISRKLEQHFPDHPHPVLHAVVDVLLTDATTGCVLLGQRNVSQVETAATLGQSLSAEEAEWVRSLYQNSDLSEISR